MCDRSVPTPGRPRPTPRWGARAAASLVVVAVLVGVGAGPAWAPRECGQCVLVSPGQAKANHPLLVRLLGFSSDTSVSVDLAVPGQGTLRLAQATTDERGTAKLGIRVPDLAPGTYAITVRSAAGELGAAELIVTAPGAAHS